MVLRDLRQRQDGFDGQTSVAEQRDVAWRRRDEGQQDMDDEEAGGEVGKELVITAQSTISSALFLAWERKEMELVYERSRVGPLPKVIRPPTPQERL